MKTLRAIVPLFALLLVCAAAWGAKPTLTPLNGENFATEVRPGENITFHLTYTQSSGDAPKELKMYLDTPSGPVTQQGQVTGGTEPAKGEIVTWSYTPINSGTYHYHFEATSSTGETVQYPDTPDGDLEFLSVSMLTKFVILAIGLVIALLFLPFIVYVATRSINKHGDPAAAARVSLVIGAAASLGLLLCLFVIQGFNYSWLGWALGALTVLSILVVIFSRRRAI